MLEVLSPHLSTAISAICVGILTMCLYFFILNLTKRWSLNTPPGPFSLPIVGYLPFLGNEPYRDFVRLSKKYGKMFSCYLGSYKVVIIGDYKVAKDVMDSPIFLGRPPHTVFTLIPDELGMVTTSGQDWQEQRKLSVTVLKYLTSKVTKLEDALQDDLTLIIHKLEESKGQPFCMRPPLSVNGMNNIWFFLFGNKIPREHPKTEFMTTVLNTMSDYFGNATACAFLPWIAKFFYYLKIGGYDKAISILKKANKVFGEEIKYLQENPDESSSEHFVSEYLRSMEAKNKKGEQTMLTYDNLRGTLQGYFLAGSESSRISTEWGLCAMVAYPEVQRRVQKEIDEVVGRERRVLWVDRFNMPYTMATIMELQRWRTLVPIPPPRYASEDTTLGGYHISKGTSVIVNIWAVHNDTDYWEDPNEFRPERFLSEDGAKTTKPDSFLPFGLGRRKCPGDEFAYTVVFIYLTSIMQKFTVKMPEGVTMDTNRFTFGITYQPQVWNMCFIPRDPNPDDVQ